MPARSKQTDPDTDGAGSVGTVGNREHTAFLRGQLPLGTSGIVPRVIGPSVVRQYNFSMEVNFEFLCKKSVIFFQVF